ncbi:MAG: pyridoxamine 5'-phosphate oxidase family protein [Chloroflexota bacterium]|nr:MAG: pyridoxamine 5'-phosphate oxidase family protein [Chloroflexota bacterium]
MPEMQRKRGEDPMAILSEEAKTIIAQTHPGLVATADKSGRPNVSAKGTFQVLDDEHVVFADVRSPRTIANLLENPQVSALVLDPATRHGVRVWGRADVLSSGELFDRLSRDLAAERKTEAKNFVVVSVDEYVTF